jgi:hypothetical protein
MNKEKEIISFQKLLVIFVRYVLPLILLWVLHETTHISAWIVYLVILPAIFLVSEWSYTTVLLSEKEGVFWPIFKAVSRDLEVVKRQQGEPTIDPVIWLNS